MRSTNRVLSRCLCTPSDHDTPHSTHIISSIGSLITTFTLPLLRSSDSSDGGRRDDWEDDADHTQVLRPLDLVLRKRHRRHRRRLWRWHGLLWLLHHRRGLRDLLLHFKRRWRLLHLLHRLHLLHSHSDWRWWWRRRLALTRRRLWLLLRDERLHEPLRERRDAAGHRLESVRRLLQHGLKRLLLHSGTRRLQRVLDVRSRLAQRLRRHLHAVLPLLRTLSTVTFSVCGSARTPVRESVTVSSLV